MSKKAMYDLRNMLCDELDELARMMEDGGYSRDEDYSRRYSRDGDWQSGMRGAYDRDMSNARRGTHYVRGHYSRDGGIDNMKRQLQEMLDNADDESIRRAIQRCMDTIEG